MSNWVILASLILFAAIIIACAFAYIQHSNKKNATDDDQDDILGI